MLTPKQVEKRTLAANKKAQREEKRYRRIIERKIEKSLEAAVAEGKVTELGGIMRASEYQPDRTIEMEYLQKYGWDVGCMKEEVSSYSRSTRSESVSLEHYYYLKPK